MALHRDIHWVGKQWAVTGYGIQACNQKQRGQFDIEASRLWDDGVQDAVRAEKWVNAEDFEKALAAARKFYPEPPRKTPPPAEATLSVDAKPALPPLTKPVPPPKPIATFKPQPKPATPTFDLRVAGGGKLTPVWRIRSLVVVAADNRPPK